MEPLQEYFATFWPPAAITIAALLLARLSYWVAKRGKDGTSTLLYQLFNWINASAALIAIVIVLPLSDETQGQVLSLLGVLLTGVLALSSTTFVSNAIAGIMLRATQPFRPGDYIRVNGQFGRVTRRSLINTEIQTEWRDLTALPNLLLLNNPITVLHRNGTIIFAEVSIGYDVTYTRVEELMLKAGTDAGLEEPFVLIHELLDHAVAYRICGFLPSMNNLLSSRSNLRKSVLEQMHGNGVEIVSPRFMNQRALDPTQKIIPQRPVVHDSNRPETVSQAPEEKIFDKALAAAGIEDLKLKQEEAQEQIANKKALLKAAGEQEAVALKNQIATLEQNVQWCKQMIEQKTAGE